MVVIIDYGVGNLGSIQNMLRKVGCQAITSSDPDVIMNAPKLLLPGVGAFDAGMQCLTERGLKPVLNDYVISRKKPVLGICLGMQLMTASSDEGSIPGLGWIDAQVKRIRPSDSTLKVPHMGWNQVRQVKDDPLLTNLVTGSRFYFVHSYHVECHNPEDVLLTTNYGGEFHSAFRHGNIWGFQFHPEKSHKFGMQLLKNFAELNQ
ncbi:imidazole glycerol phosphate synthase [Vogesella sp. EB]|uniref:Imidazole glycerol phosphate synthase subunit HisH n=1 Tax=Vogesella indigofera TaxID=45465 RepID=A0A495BG97_VOGIN|nr:MULTISPECIES: imidazole glycerol phosphate synthase subunit HisH [Vogesella]KMJ53613.1 imidazole glycerol phosphate synthase [Vogesella sp. EB]RKQ58705.1 glutamine amidotransferase [Vogesella indigofera]